MGSNAVDVNVDGIKLEDEHGTFLFTLLFFRKCITLTDEMM